jgi:hypothetical protein
MKEELVARMTSSTGLDMAKLIQEHETTYLGGSLFE